MTDKTENQLVIAGGLPALNNYEAYKRYVKAIPNITQEEEEHLVQLMIKENSVDAAKKLIVSQLKNVLYIAEQYKNYGLPEEDLVQEGNIGLMKAVKNFNPEHKVRLYTYALIWIKAEIQTYVMKNLKQVSLPSTKNMKKLFFNFRKIQQEMIGIGISKDKIKQFMSNKLDVSEEEVEEAQRYFLGNDVSIYENQNQDDDGDSFNPYLDALIVDEQTPESLMLEDNAETEKTEMLSYMLASLNERQRAVIEGRFLLEDKKTHKELAEELGVSNERVRQIEQEAITKMKKNLSLKYKKPDPSNLLDIL